MPKLSYTAETMPTPEEFQRQLTQAMSEANPIDDLLLLAEELRSYEMRYGLTSADFWRKYQAGALSDDLQHCVEWAATYDLFTEQKHLLETALMRAAIAPSIITQEAQERVFA